MPDRLSALLIRLYPKDFRARFGPQIQADLAQPDSSHWCAAADVVRAAILLRLTTPGLYIWLASVTLAAAVVSLSGAVSLRQAYKALQPRLGSTAELYALIFFAIFFVVAGTLVLAIHWLQTYRYMISKCSKSRI